MKLLGVFLSMLLSVSVMAGTGSGAPLGVMAHKNQGVRVLDFRKKKNQGVRVLDFRKKGLEGV